jgi:3-hydroxyacyl-CoA dehydrogenase
MISREDVEVLVVGTGRMGWTIALAFAQNGVKVGLIGRRRESLERARDFIRESLNEAIQKGLFTPQQGEEIGERIFFGLNLEEACRGRNLRFVIESVSENLALKKELFNWLGEFCAPGVVLASNTSCLDAELIVAETLSPERALWVHFFFPAHKNRAAEYAPLRRTSERHLQVAEEYLGRSRRASVRLLRFRKGGAANVILIALILEAVRLIEEGFGAASVDEASRSALGIPSGFLGMLQTTGWELAASCLASFSAAAAPDDPLHRVYDNFFNPPDSLRRKLAEPQREGDYISPDRLFGPEAMSRPADPQVVEDLKRRVLAVAYMTAAEVVEAGIIQPASVDLLCRQAFLWKDGPFALMNRLGPALVLQLVTERMQLSHRQEINFPIPRLLIEHGAKNEPWVL